MPIIDPASDIGKVRLKTGDTRDIPILPDDVIQQVLVESNNNIRQAVTTCGQYILATLSFDSDARLGLLYTYGSQTFEQYKNYLMLILKDPAFNGVCPLPYVAGAKELHPILQFQQDFTNAENRPTSDERLHQIATQPFDPYSGPVANLNPLMNNSNGVLDG
jgi:hypothetical protein